MIYFKRTLFNRVFIFIFFLLIFGLTILRENLFLDINSVIENYDFNSTYFYYFHSKLLNFNSSELFQLKWLLTILFSVVISGLSTLVISFWFRGGKILRYVIYVYVSICTFFIIAAFLLWCVNGVDEYYFVLRKITGFVQSPLPLIIMMPIFYVLEDK